MKNDSEKLELQMRNRKLEKGLIDMVTTSCLEHAKYLEVKRNKSKRNELPIENSFDSKASDKVIVVPDEEIEAYRNEMLTTLEVSMTKIRKMTYYLNERKASREFITVTFIAKCQCQNLKAMKVMVENSGDIDAIRVIDIGYKWRMKIFGVWKYF